MAKIHLVANTFQITELFKVEKLERCNVYQLVDRVMQQIMNI